MILHLEHNAIDKASWDKCIRNSPNGLLYACSWYLDLVCPGWEALVEDNYESVMPLPSRIKMGIQYLFRPDFCQQLGVFSISGVVCEKLLQFIDHIPAKYQLIDMPLNEGNCFEIKAHSLQTRINYLLHLSGSYELLQASYATNTRRNIKKSASLGIRVDEIKDIAPLIKLVGAGNFIRMNEERVQIILGIWDHFSAENSARIIGVNNEMGEPEAAALFVKFNNRWVYIVSASSSTGKEKRAMFAIIDHFIRQHAGMDQWLDFEGSTIPDVARFFAGFGAKPVNYPHLHYNRLPWPLKWIKRWSGI